MREEEGWMVREEEGRKDAGGGRVDGEGQTKREGRR